ncbi:MAG: flagellar biosynthetic protein FliO [Polyangiaceae bacterium]|nr:flagellar biosynthetic protein FliO [Polyangiaceae bacterium]
MNALLSAADVHGLPGYGASLLQTLVALVAVCLLSYVAIRLGLGRALGATGLGRRMRVVERLPLDARRALVLVEIGDRVYLLGTGDGAAPSLLSELPKEAFPEIPEAERAKGFRALLDRDRGR